MNNNEPHAKFRLNDYLVEAASITIKTVETGKELECVINPNGSIDDEKKIFMLKLDVNVSDKENTFNVDLKMKAEFAFDSNDRNTLMNFIGMNAPAIIFPYVRAYVSNITALSGMQPIIMPTLNMSNVGKRLVDILNSKRYEE